jgi:hypothetical protein
MKTTTSIVFLGILLVLLVQTGCADIGFDDFRVTVNPDKINVSDSFDVNMTFKGPSDTDTVTVELEVIVDGVTVFLDKDYDIHFTQDEDETITLSSDSDFPGPDLDSDYFNDNLMNYACDDFTVEVRVSGSDLNDDYSDEASLAIGDDDEKLSFEMDPTKPKPFNETIFTVYDENDDKLKSATVKLTWLDDPNGDIAGKWDSADSKWSSTTNSKGEKTVIIGEVDKFKNSNGTFQVDVYSRGYCLERKTFEMSSGKLILKFTPIKPAGGEPVSICATDSDGTDVPATAVYVQGPGHSKTYTTGSTGCVSLTLSTLGTYHVSASKEGYVESLDNLLYVQEKETTTTTMTTTTTSSVATTRATTTTKPAEKLFIYLSDMTPYVNETVKVTIKDVQSSPIKGITIGVSPSGVTGKTNEEGIFSFVPETSGTYTIIASSDNSAYSSASENIEAKNPPIQEKPSGGGLVINPVMLLVVGVAIVVLLAIGVVVVLLLKKPQTKKAKKKDWSGNKPERWISIKDDVNEE